jgi:Lrp/AsnC family transcriptional regulator, leucine-responsive regulatory protein
MSQKLPKQTLDATDKSMLALLQQDGSLSHAQLAERVALSVTPCWRRLKRLEEDGFITGYQANLSRRKLGLDVLAFVQLRFMVVSDGGVKQFEALIQDHPAVLSCHKVTGDADYLLQVVATDLDAYGTFVENVLRTIPGISMVHSNLAMREIKAVNRLPVEMAQ